MDPDDDLIHRVHSLSDLELAVLLSLVSREHCVIGTPRVGVDDLVDELFLIATKVFGLSCAIVDCHKDTTLDDFSASILLPAAAAHRDRSLTRPQSSRSPPSYLLMTPASVASASTTPTASAHPAVANVVLAKNLNRAPEAVQIQALELLRAKGALPRAAGQAPPRPFLLVAVVAAARGFRWDGPTDQPDADAHHPPHMTAHLNNAFAMGHWHDLDDGYPNVEEEEEQHEDEKLTPTGRMEPAAARRRWRHDSENENDTDADSVVKYTEPDFRAHSASMASLGASTRRASHVDSIGGLSNSSTHVTHATHATHAVEPFVSEADVDHLAALGSAVRVDMDVLRYQMNIVAFLRLHRAVAVISRACSGTSSVSPTATKHFEKLARCLAPLHHLDYVTPALVALAARKVYLHRIRTIQTAEANHERSMQWGSTRTAVEAVLEGVSPEDVVEDVLGVVMPPV